MGTFQPSSRLCTNAPTPILLNVGFEDAMDETAEDSRPAQIEWSVVKFGDMSPKDLYELLALRTAVFVVEQHCPYQECDGLDYEAIHIIGRCIAENPRIVAYMRCLAPGVVFPEAAFGRVIVAKEMRGGQLGKELVGRGLAIRSTWPGKGLKINAQVGLVRYYRHFGFEPVGEPYDEDGIEHIAMALKEVS